MVLKERVGMEDTSETLALAGGAFETREDAQEFVNKAMQNTDTKDGNQ